jgi:tRNA pseudouridine38-40 synthase
VVSERRHATFRLGVEYDGTAFHGWQVQRSHRTVQGDLEAALARLAGAPVRVTGAGRTDAGCHAVGQVASAALSTRMTAERLQAALNAILPRDVRVVDMAEAPPEFHARFDATRRAYRYLIEPRASALRSRYAWQRPVRAAVDDLNDASRPLLGEHDFTSFSRQGGDADDRPICRVARARWTERRGRLRFDIESDRFLYTMVRRIVSSLLRAAEDGSGAHGVRTILAKRDRRAAAPPAPAHGLYLMRVKYPRVGWIPKEPLDVPA